MARPRNDDRRFDMREKLLEVALDEFSRNGYRASGIREIAAAAGIKESSLYHYFSGKEELFESILESVKAGFRQVLPPEELIPELMDRTDIVSFMLTGLTRLLDRLDAPDLSSMMRLALSERYRHPAAAEGIEEYFRTTISFATAVFEYEGRRSGESRIGAHDAACIVEHFVFSRLMEYVAAAGDEERSERIREGLKAQLRLIVENIFGKGETPA